MRAWSDLIKGNRKVEAMAGKMGISVRAVLATGPLTGCERENLAKLERVVRQSLQAEIDLGSAARAFPSQTAGRDLPETSK